MVDLDLKEKEIKDKMLKIWHEFKLLDLCHLTKFLLNMFPYYYDKKQNNYTRMIFLK